MARPVRRDADVPAREPDAPFVLVRGGEVFAPEPLGRRDVLVAAGRIVSVAPSIEVPTGLGDVRVVEAGGRRVVPGLVDGHVHILGGGGEGGGHTRNRDLVLTDATAAGVTTLVGCLGMDYMTRHVTSLLAKARGLEVEGLTTFITTGGYAVPTPTITGSVLGDLTWIEKVVGVGEVAISDHRSSHAPQEMLAQLAAEARMGGLYGDKAGLVLLHVGRGKRALEPLRRLVDGTDIPITQFLPTHVNRSPDRWEQAVAFARSGGTIDITAGIAPARGFPEALKPADAVADALGQGVPIERVTMSSDANGNMPFLDEEGRLVRLVVQAVRDLFDELRDLVVVNGLPLESALRPFTTNVARVFKLRAKGRLVAGNDGDVLVLSDDFDVEGLVARGRVLVEHGTPTARGIFE